MVIQNPLHLGVISYNHHPRSNTLLGCRVQFLILSHKQLNRRDNFISSLETNGGSQWFPSVFLPVNPRLIKQSAQVTTLGDAKLSVRRKTQNSVLKNIGVAKKFSRFLN